MPWKAGRVMLTIERRAWVEEVGRNVLLFRVPGADITLAWGIFWPRIGIYLHDGVPASYRWPTGEHDVIVRRTGMPDATLPPAPVDFGEPASPWIQ